MKRNLEKLSGIIVKDFKEDNVPTKKLNVERLLESDFIDRFLGFIEEYESVCGINLFDTVSDWLSEEEYDYIKYFLNTTVSEYHLPFDIRDFIYMDYDKFIDYQEKCIKISALLDEKKSLYQEFNSFYE